MIALQITSMKLFMNQLLMTDAFDIFLLEEAVVNTANSFTIDGHINRDFFSGAEPVELPYELRPWSEIRGLCFDLIKGKRTPLGFRFVLHLKPENTAALLGKSDCGADPASIRAFVLTIRYDGSRATLTTGTAYETFLLSKEADILWDKSLAQYLDRRGIPFEML